MHIIIGLLTSIAGLVWALHSLQNAGFDLNSLNPFAWARRRRWKKKLGVHPIHAITDSMDVAALLVVSVAKQQGEITRETKIEILRLFEDEFGVKRNKAIEMFSSSTYMLQDILTMANEVQRVLSPSKETFTPNHISKLMAMLQVAAKLEGDPTDEQKDIITSVESVFNLDEPQASQW